MKRSHFIRVVSVHREGRLVYGRWQKAVLVHLGGHLVYGRGLGVRSCGEIAIFVTTDASREKAVPKGNSSIMRNSSIMENNGNIAHEAVMDVILSRKSVRKYTAEPLTEAEIETLLRAGMAAPSAKNIQPWSFIVVTDKEVAKRLVTKSVNRMYPEAPCLIVVCGDLNTDAKPHDVPKDSPAIERQNPNWMIDCSAAAENILLAAEAMGLGAVWTACWPYEDRYSVVKEVLGIPENMMPLAIIPVGHPAETPAPKDKWRPEKIHRGRW